MEAEALAARREAARREGFAQGHIEGLAAGNDAGRAGGFAQGQAEGRAQGMAEAAQEVSLLRSAAAAWKEADMQISDFLERCVLQLSLDIARHVIRKEVSATTREALQSGLKRLAGELGIAQSPVVWTLHPDQAEMLKAHCEEWPDQWVIHGDDSMAPGGVRIRAQWPDVMEDGRTISQEWDARVETRWADMVARVLEGN